MDSLPKPAPPIFVTRTPSATFPLTHGSAPSQRPKDQPTREHPLAGHHESLWPDQKPYQRVHSQNGVDEQTSPGSVPTNSRAQHPRPDHIDLVNLVGSKSHHRHKHSKSRELRLPRPMSHLASSASARGLIPTWSGSRDKDREGDDGLLRPITRETTRSRWGSDSTTGLGTASRKGSLLDSPDQHERLSPIRRQEIQSMEDLELLKKRRKQGEEYLRSALSSIGTLATDLTRRLDYTYYNLLEKVTALHSTIGSFQELSDSASTLLNEFEHETAGLDQDIRKQINDLKGFEPQIQKADTLEARMKKGQKRVEELGARLENVRQAIDNWEMRETEWQSCVNRRLRIFWTVVTSVLLAIMLALVLPNWPSLGLPNEDILSQGAIPNPSMSGVPDSSAVQESLMGHDASDSEPSSPYYPSSLAHRRQSLEQKASRVTSFVNSQYEPVAVPTELEALRILDEL